MKRIAALVCLLFMLWSCPVLAENTSLPERDAFYTESEAQELVGYDNDPHPIIWVFVGVGVAALATCVVINHMAKEKIK